MDNIDRITELELGLFELRLKAVTCKPLRQSALYCTECGNDIPDRRRKTLPGVQLCVGCKEVTEVRDRNFGGRA
ncbi:conjugal transfer protein TraR [Rahnella sp. AA]|uniref:TraR/DksA C4-type zinc finger protein n=1 Tax=Rahnella sp. AA TaxID=2057180 RepID=UPI000C32A9A0|nr:TraR/DksA C4-type zinc finger protein [Rahnella sp. AA]PKE28125.1 conjugal transfer protein TraR [Rahnella sp. AA]